MKKKIIAVLMLFMALSPAAQARGWHGGHGMGHPGPVYHHHHHHTGANIAAGIIGTTAGILLAEQLIYSRPQRVEAQPRVYLVEPEGKCYTIISRKTGKISQQCVNNASTDTIYID